MSPRDAAYGFGVSRRPLASLGFTFPGSSVSPSTISVSSFRLSVLPLASTRRSGRGSPRCFGTAAFRRPRACSYSSLDILIMLPHKRRMERRPGCRGSRGHLRHGRTHRIQRRREHRRRGEGFPGTGHGAARDRGQQQQPGRYRRSEHRPAGAIVVNESQQGYGHCVHRCLTEALRHSDTSYVVLCEGDGTFRGDDLAKLLQYRQHADIVNGTRIVEQLRDYRTQLTTFMYYRQLFYGQAPGTETLGPWHLHRCGHDV